MISRDNCIYRQILSLHIKENGTKYFRAKPQFSYITFFYDTSQVDNLTSLYIRIKKSTVKTLYSASSKISCKINL